VTARACRICGNTAGNAAHEVREMQFGTRDRFAYVQCARCQCLQIAEVPADLDAYYPPTYYSYTPAPVPPPPPAGLVRRKARQLRDGYTVSGQGVGGRLLCRLSPDPALQAAVARHFPGDIRHRLPLTPRSRILDVGCGAGAFLARLHAAGFRNVLGIDPFLARDLAFPGGLRVLKADLRAVAGTWDLVMFHHSFEHMADPGTVLAATAARLGRAGACLLRLPVVPSYAWETYGVDWAQLDAPRHLFVHSIESIKLLARDAGLRVQAVVYDSDAFQFYASEQYRRDIPLRDARSYATDPARSIFSPADIAEFERRAAQLNREGRGDQAAIVLGRA
jgi:SAM-dependent methyltransferase